MKIAILIAVLLLIASSAYAEQVMKGRSQCSTTPPPATIWVEEQTPKQIKELEDRHFPGGWVKCPVCENYYGKGEYFTHHKLIHIKKEDYCKYFKYVTHTVIVVEIKDCEPIRYVVDDKLIKVASHHFYNDKSCDETILYYNGWAK